MYHERTAAQMQRRRQWRWLLLALAVILAWGVHSVSGVVSVNTRDQGAASLRESVLRAARQCCAVEGSYPADLIYLEDNYGLAINRSDYVVYYEWFASNVAPTVTVVPR